MTAKVVFLLGVVVCSNAQLGGYGSFGGYSGGGEGGGLEGGYGGLEGGYGGEGHGHIVKTIEPVYGPQPYKFGYKIKDEHGAELHREEKSDEHNIKTGSYGYRDAHGIYRQVNYVADGHGFRATVHTNEPGTQQSHPADAEYHAPYGVQHHYHHSHHEHY